MTDLDQILDAITQLSLKVDRVETKLDAHEALVANYVRATGEDLDKVRDRLERIERPKNGLHLV
jgi:hypothetical protein